MTGYIYCIANKINGKKYVGKTLYSLKRRFAEHCRDAKRTHMEQRPLYSAMNKYGSENFAIELLEEVTTEELALKEMEWIEKLNTYKCGYNATLGGDGKILYGEDAVLAFIYDFENGMSINKISKKHGCDAGIVNQRLKAAGINTRKNKSQNKTKVNQYDCDGNFIQSFQSITDAARYLVNRGLATTIDCAVSNIQAAARGKRKTCRGYVWQYAS